MGVSADDAVSPVHWLAGAARYHGGSKEAVLRFGASLAHYGQPDVAAQWLAKVAP